MSGRREEGARLEMASAVILSIAALGSSWASYQAGLWDGEQASHYSRANALRIEASRAALEGDAVASLEVQMFGAWLDAKVRGEETLARIYEARFPEHMKPAFNAWVREDPFRRPSAPRSPFTMSTYKRPGLAASQALERQANETFERGQRGNAISDGFEQGATILAVSLFFGGIGQAFKSKQARIALMIMAGVALVAGLLRLVGLPIQVLGFGALG